MSCQSLIARNETNDLDKNCGAGKKLFYMPSACAGGGKCTECHGELAKPTWHVTARSREFGKGLSGWLATYPAIPTPSFDCQRRFAGELLHKSQKSSTCSINYINDATALLKSSMATGHLSWCACEFVDGKLTHVPLPFPCKRSHPWRVSVGIIAVLHFCTPQPSIFCRRLSWHKKRSYLLSPRIACPFFVLRLTER